MKNNLDLILQQIYENHIKVRNLMIRISFNNK